MLLSHFLFEDTHPADLDYVIAAGLHLHLPRGESLFRKGESVRGLFVIINGAVSQVYSQRQIPSEEQLPANPELRVNSTPIELEPNCHDLVTLTRPSRATWAPCWARAPF